LEAYSRMGRTYVMYARGNNVRFRVESPLNSVAGVCFGDNIINMDIKHQTTINLNAEITNRFDTLNNTITEPVA